MISAFYSYYHCIFTVNIVNTVFFLFLFDNNKFVSLRLSEQTSNISLLKTLTMYLVYAAILLFINNQKKKYENHF